MLLTTFLVILISFGFLFLNIKNKFAYIIIAYFICLSMLLIINVLYISKVSTYKFPMQIDYKIYLLFYNVKLLINSISRIYNFTLAFFMVICIVTLTFFVRVRLKLLVLLFVPIIIFLVWTDYSVVYSLHILSLTNIQYSNIINLSVEAGNLLCENLIFIYMIILHIAIIKAYFDTKIYTKKKNYIVLHLCVLLINLFFLFVFVIGPFRFILFSNVDAFKFPNYSGIKNGYIVIPFVFMGMVGAVSILLILFKPFGVFYGISKNATVETAKLFNKNLSMILHVYKNAFLAIGQQINLIRINSNRSMDINANSDLAMDLVNEYMLMIDKTLSLLKGKGEVFKVVNLLRCINVASKNIVDKDNVKIINNFYDDEVLIYGDEFHLTEVFVNLFLNAIDAIKPTGRAPVIELYLTVEDDYCMVKDNGIGIEKKQLRKIFEPFYSSKPRKQGGGIGLSYVKNIIRQHKGEIRVKSVVGVYTNFQIILPLNRAC